MTGSTAGEIAPAFEDEGFAPNPHCATGTAACGQTLQEYLGAIDWSDPGHVARTLRVFGRLI